MCSRRKSAWLNRNTIIGSANRRSPMRRERALRVSNHSLSVLFTGLVAMGLLVPTHPDRIAYADERRVELPTIKGGFLGYRTAVAIAIEQHPLLKKTQETSLSAHASAEQANARYYPQIDAYAIQTGGTIRPLSGFNIAGAQNKPTSYIENA